MNGQRFFKSYLGMLDLPFLFGPVPWLGFVKPKLRLALLLILTAGRAPLLVYPPPSWKPPWLTFFLPLALFAADLLPVALC
jgi:hypothetical protein